MSTSKCFAQLPINNKCSSAHLCSRGEWVSEREEVGNRERKINLRVVMSSCDGGGGGGGGLAKNPKKLSFVLAQRQVLYLKFYVCCCFTWMLRRISIRQCWYLYDIWQYRPCGIGIDSHPTVLTRCGSTSDAEIRAPSAWNPEMSKVLQ